MYCLNCKLNLVKSTTKKYCSLSCSTAYRNYLIKIQNIEKYRLSPTKCLYCSDELSYVRRNNKFCSNSCSAKFSNKHRDYSKFKPGPKKHKNRILHQNVIKLPPFKIPILKDCIICNNLHSNIGKTCSLRCRSTHISNSVKGKTGGNRDLNLPGADSYGNKFYFDSSWEVNLSINLTENNIKWLRPKKFILSDNRSYTPDFYLPDYKIYIDPKAKRPGYYRKSIYKIEMFEKEYQQKCIVISNPKLLTWSHIQSMLIVRNYRS